MGELVVIGGYTHKVATHLKLLGYSWSLTGRKSSAWARTLSCGTIVELENSDHRAPYSADKPVLVIERTRDGSILRQRWTSNLAMAIITARMWEL